MQRVTSKSDKKPIKILLVGNDLDGKCKFSKKVSEMDEEFYDRNNLGIDLISCRIDDREIQIKQTTSLSQFEFTNEIHYKSNMYQGIVIIADEKFEYCKELEDKLKQIPSVKGSDYISPKYCLEALYKEIKKQEKEEKATPSYAASSIFTSKDYEKKKIPEAKKDSSGGFVEFFKGKYKEYQIKKSQAELQKKSQPDVKQFSIND